MYSLYNLNRRQSLTKHFFVNHCISDKHSGVKDLPLLDYAGDFSQLAVLTFFFDDVTLNSLFWFGKITIAPLTSQTPLDWAGGRQSSGVWRASTPNPEHSQTQSPAHNHDKPEPTSDGEPTPAATDEPQLESQQLCALRWMRQWRARAWRRAPPTVPPLRVSWGRNREI